MEIVLGITSLLGGIFGGSKQIDMTPIYRAMQENQKQFEITINQLNQSQQKMIEDFNKIKEENKSFHEEIIKQRNEELKKKEENEKKIKEAIKKTTEELLKKTNEGCDKLLNECEKVFDDNKNKWCLEDINKKNFKFQLFKKVSDNIKLEENYKTKIKKEINKFSIKNISNFNIQIVGCTGVGKSTLINSILREENNKAPTSFGKIGTLETKEYKSNKYKFIKFIDTRGSELDEKNNIKSVLNETLKYIDEKLSINDPNNIIHCLFYCIDGNRFQDIELTFLMALRNKYKNYEKKEKYLPIIIVYTQCISNKDFEDMKTHINQILTNNKLDIIGEGEKDINMINILAESKEIDEGIFPAKNLDKLMELAKNKSNLAINLATLNMIQEVCKSEANQFFEKQENILIKSVDDFLKNKKDDEIIKSIFIECFKKYYNEDFDLSIECENIINDISNQLMEFIEEINNNNLNKFIEKNSDYISKELLNIQTEIINKNEGNVNNLVKNINTWKDEGKTKLRNRLLNKSKNYAIKNLSKKLYFDIAYDLKRSFQDLISRVIKCNDIEKEINNKISNGMSKEILEGFDQLIEELKNYQEEEKVRCEYYNSNI